MRILLILLCILPQVWSLTAQEEMFPWSPFPMYSGLDSGQDLVLLSAYVLDEKNNFTPIERAITLRPKYEYRWRIPSEKVWKRGLNDPEKDVLLKFAGIFAEDLKKFPLTSQRYMKLIFCLEYWKHFEGIKRYTPDERRILIEYPL
jgi:hypothetical protein